ncbi:hypothetical protein A9Q83_11760 [Alphaproteobacteria bacterium 46_93_T64]|nr:hypothetical protein A9Q83_11760 [Alphaproteobacteria bacterium 46_93_T64]
MNQLSPFPTTSEELSNWVTETGKITNSLALKRAKTAFIDTIACILGAADEPVTKKVFEGLRGSGGGLCSVVGRAETLSAENAALVNGTAAHALDFDDNFLPAVTHASAVLVPALLSLGEEVGASCDQLLDAYIVGLEVQAWLGHHMIPVHYAAGWHATSTLGTIGAAAACVRILTLDTSTARSAISLATSMACGSKIQFGSMTKPLHAGLAARAGVTAARLAAAGVEGHAEPFDGPWGFMSLHHATKRSNIPENRELSILKHGLAHKKWPCCASAHRTLDAIYEMIEEHSLSTENIEKIDTIIPESNVKNLRFDNPKTVNEARFSMPFTAATLVCSKNLTLNDFTETTLHRQDVRNFMPRVFMHAAPAQTQEETGIWDIPAVTTILTTNGQRITKKIQQPVGTIHIPLTDEDLELKFLECAGRTLSTEQARQFFDCLQDFEQQNARHVASYLRNIGANRNRSHHQPVPEHKMDF